jgi:rhodanese-related sulfurtransferase
MRSVRSSPPGRSWSKSSRPRSSRKNTSPGAINIPLKQLTEQATAPLDRAGPVIVYCWDYQ